MAPRQKSRHEHARQCDLRLISIAFVLMASLILCWHDAEAGPIQHRFRRRATFRLCSKNLSDALHLICQGRGYNEPFSNSGETEVRSVNGPGLADECCHNACSSEQLEQYCKPRVRG